MKRLSVLVLLALGITFVSAQKKGTDWLKVGVHAGVPMGDFSKASSLALGADVKYQFLDLKSFGLGFSTAYTHYLGKKGNKDFGVIPLSLLLRYYPTKHFFIGSDVGVGFVLANKNDKSAFYYRPELGYHSDEWNIFLYYQGLTVNKINNLGLGINYNIIRPHL